jgi:hypothetical protein
MILPTKHIGLQRSLLGIGADILLVAREPMTVSRLWEEFKRARVGSEARRVPFEWFVLALDLLFIVGAIKYVQGRVSRGDAN